MIDDREIRDRVTRLGVSENQVRRDHLLSHLIHALPREDRVVFIGGTALNRTHLPDVRLSEDLDLHLIEGDAEELVDRLLDEVRLEYPGSSVVSRVTRYDVATYFLEVDRLRVQIQIIKNRPEWQKLPTKRLRQARRPCGMKVQVKGVNKHHVGPPEIGREVSSMTGSQGSRMEVKSPQVHSQICALRTDAHGIRNMGDRAGLGRVRTSGSMSAVRRSR